MERDSENYVLELERFIERILAEYSDLEEKYSSLLGENESLRKKLLLYENPHTPPSRRMFPPKTTNPPGKRGAPGGHRGATRILDEPDEYKTYRCDICDMDFVNRWNYESHLKANGHKQKAVSEQTLSLSKDARSRHINNNNARKKI